MKYPVGHFGGRDVGAVRLFRQLSAEISDEPCISGCASSPCLSGCPARRRRTEAAWARLCAAAPIPASSGKVTRHRLNPGGDRQANNALWRIAFTRMGSDPATRAYVERRTKEGKSKAEIIRCLKRYVAREVYPHLRPTAD
jgi:Transposase IS116/IS110/IS902 family